MNYFEIRERCKSNTIDDFIIDTSIILSKIENNEWRTRGI